MCHGAGAKPAQEMVKWVRYRCREVRPPRPSHRGPGVPGALCAFCADLCCAGIIPRVSHGSLRARRVQHLVKPDHSRSWRPRRFATAPYMHMHTHMHMVFCVPGVNLAFHCWPAGPSIMSRMCAIMAAASLRHPEVEVSLGATSFCAHSAARAHAWRHWARAGRSTKEETKSRPSR